MEMTFASLCRTILMLQKSITNAKIISAWQQYSLMENFRHFQEIKIIGICRTGITQAGASIPLRQMMHFPPVSDFPHFFQKICQPPWNIFLNSPFPQNIFQISSKLSLFQYRGNFFTPTFVNFPTYFVKFTFFTYFMCFLFPLV